MAEGSRQCYKSHNPILFEASDWWKASTCGTSGNVQRYMTTANRTPTVAKVRGKRRLLADDRVPTATYRGSDKVYGDRAAVDGGNSPPCDVFMMDQE